MQLLIVRHGHCLGQCAPDDPSPDSALSPLGEQQARLAAHRLAAGNVWAMTEREHEEWLGRPGAPPPSKASKPYVLSSPLIRALATASMIADALGGQPVEVWPELRELSLLQHRGFGRVELQQRFPHAVLPASITDNGWEHGDPSVDAVVLRCQHVRTMLQERFTADDHVVMVTHGGFVNALLHTLLRISPTSPAWFAMANGGFSPVRLVPEQERAGWPPLFPPVAAEIVYWNDVSHLTAGPSPLAQRGPDGE